MSRYKVKRMLPLADYLDMIPDDKFNINRWFGYDDCGTIACAIGHACSMKKFKQLGLKIRSYPDSPYREPALYDDNVITHSGIDVTEELFGISYYEARELFTGIGYYSYISTLNVTPKIVANKLREFVKQKLNTKE